MTLTFCIALQREGAAEEVSVRQQSQQAAADSAAPQDVQTKPKAVDKHRNVLRSYGQKKAKADSSADNASATLSSDFLALVGGQQ